MNHRRGLVALVLVLGGCSAGAESLAGPPDGDVRHHDGGTDAGPPDATLIHDPSGLPCDVEAVLAAECTVCHTRPPTGDAPRALLTYEDLTMPSSDPTTTVAELVLQRMTAHVMPPPPSPPVTDAEIATVRDWVMAGTPPGPASCPPTSPYDGTSRCTSGATWTMGNDASELMHPGVACLSCHQTVSNPPDPAGTLAGTVYPSIHEPDDCNGIEGTITDPVTITVRDVNGHEVSAVANAAGNFFSAEPIALPIVWATVTYQGRTRAMASVQPSADCNACHTEGGILGAPGRILLP